jgi:hypothetical protein
MRRLGWGTGGARCLLSPKTSAPEDDSQAQQYSRAEETCDASLTPTADATAVTLARLSYVKKRWAIDRSCRAPRIRR